MSAVAEAAECPTIVETSAMAVFDASAKLTKLCRCLWKVSFGQVGLHAENQPSATPADPLRLGVGEPSGSL